MSSETSPKPRLVGPAASWAHRIERALAKNGRITGVSVLGQEIKRGDCNVVDFLTASGVSSRTESSVTLSCRDCCNTIRVEGVQLERATSPSYFSTRYLWCSACEKRLSKL